MTTANVNITKVLLKRGNTTQNDNYTGVFGEITVDTQVKTLRIHDGVTVGGNILTASGAVGSYSNVNTAAYLTSQSITSANIGAFQTFANANANVQATSINSINANVGAFQTFANANAASQTTEINSLRSNVTAANAAITALQSNAAIQQAILDTLTSNAATQSTVLDTLTSNAAAQATSLTTLLSNAVAQQTSLIDLVANAATQAQAIANVTGTYSNANVATYLSSFNGNILPSANVTYSLGSSTRQWQDLWVSNNTIYIGNVPLTVSNGNLLVNGSLVTGSGSGTDDVLRANVGAYQTFANANAATQATSINTFNANLGAYQTFANANLATQTTNINTVNANIGAYYAFANANAATQATSINTFNANLGAYQTYANANVVAIQANLGAYQTFANANAATQATSINTFNANLGAFQTYANTTYGTSSYSNVTANALLSSNTVSTINTTGNIATIANVIAPRYLFANGVNILSTVGAGTYGNTQVASYLPTYTGNIAGNIAKNGYTWTFGTGGNLTVPASGIITAPDAQEFRLQARAADSVLRNEINLDPNEGTYMSVWSEELSTSFSTGAGSWVTASWVNASGFGAAYFTGAEDLQDFWTTGPGSFVENFEVSINGGARGRAGYEGNNGGGSGVELSVDRIPVSSPTAITSLTFYYRTKNRIDIDYLNGQILLNAQSMNINLETNSYINLKSTRANPVRIFTNDTTNKWEFDSTGSLTLPNGAVIKDTANNAVAFGASAGQTSQGNVAVAVGAGAGTTTQGIWAVAVGSVAGGNYQGSGAVAVGAGAGNDSQGEAAVAVGSNAGFMNQGETAVAVGLQTGVTSQGVGAVAIGYSTAYDSQGASAVAIGSQTGQTSQGASAVAVGSGAGYYKQSEFSVAIGRDAGKGGEYTATYVSGAYPTGTTLVVNSTTGIATGMFISGNGFVTDQTVVTVTNSTTLEISSSADSAPSGTLTFSGYQGNNAVAIGPQAGGTHQGNSTVAVGASAGSINQGEDSVAVGKSAGQQSQSYYSTAIGTGAGQTNQQSGATALGRGAGSIDQGFSAVAVGVGAGSNYQSASTVAVGGAAGGNVQGQSAVAIGFYAGFEHQGVGAIAIGIQSGYDTQGQNSVAIGTNAGYTAQGNNSIILNATGANLNATTANTFTVAPVRNDVANVSSVMFYNTTSKEITYGNTISVAGNINASQFNFANGVNILSTVGASAYGNTEVKAYLATAVGFADGYQRKIEGYYANLSLGGTAALNSYGVTSKSYLGHNGFVGNAGISSVNVDNYNIQIATYNGDYTWTFDNSGTLTLPTTANINFANGVNILSTVGAGSYGNANVASYLLHFDGDIEFTSSTARIGNVEVITVGDHIRSPAYQFSNGTSILAGITGTYSNTNVAAYLTTATITTTGNITAGNVSAVNFVGTIQAQVGSSFAYATDAYGSLFNTGGVFLTPDSNSNAIVAGYTIVGNSGAVTLTVTSATFIPGPPNIVQVATTPTASSLAYPVTVYSANYSPAIPVSTITVGNATVSGNVIAPNYRFSNGASILSNVVSKTAGSWTVTAGTNTYSFTVPASGTYQLWVECNIPNGIIAWNATATITNSNVPVVGQQFAWVYTGGGTPVDFTSIPNQFTGTANTIVRSNTAPSATTNRFDFGINNASGGNVTASYGYVKIS